MFYLIYLVAGLLVPDWTEANDAAAEQRNARDVYYAGEDDEDKVCRILHE